MAEKVRPALCWANLCSHGVVADVLMCAGVLVRPKGPTLLSADSFVPWV